MKYWRSPIFLKLIAWLSLCLMAINPVLALQYNQLNQTTHFSSKIPGYLPKTMHIHASQKDSVLALLAKQGYDIIPASPEDARHFLSSNSFSDNISLQLAANFNLKLVPVDACSKKLEYCSGDECNEQLKDKQVECKEEPKSDKKPEQKPGPTTTITHGQGFQLPNFGGGGGGGGGKGDSAAVMLIIIGVVVVAALFIYAGKFIVDLINNNEDYYAYWWDIGTQFINLNTEANQHGNFSGLKLGAGFIANRSTQFGLTAEIGKMDLDLLYNRNSIPQRINLQGTYWLLGPTVRWLLGNIDTEQTINNSYVYLELLGGGSDRKEVDITAVARLGVNTGIGEHMRIGIHYGAFYLGLDEDQGFANDGDNYWNMYGLEIGYQF